MFIAGLLTALLTASVLFFYGGPDAYSIRSLTELWNLGHVLYFGLLVYLLSRYVFIGRLSRKHTWIFSLLLTLVLGLLVELVQSQNGRSADVNDLSRNFCGALLALAFMPGLISLSSGKLIVAIRILVLSFGVFHLSPLAIVLSDEIAARKQFPVLSDFNMPFEIDRWSGNADVTIVSGFAGKPGRQLKIDLGTQRYSGTGIDYLRTDWRGYNTLNLEIYHPASIPLPLTLKIYDEQHRSEQSGWRYSDRFNQKYQLNSGWNYIRIDLEDIQQAPKTREMDMSKMVSISFFAMNLKQPLTIYLDRVYLN
ncbi:MAG: hypothetical protein GY784_05940 [Gammaproteobacteria bacterium]|nr:hypothetical protein [Gammaproteobacteria bacterium]